MSIEVWNDDQLAGSLRRETRPGFYSESLTFEYSAEWLSKPTSFALSPDLPLVPGPHTPASHRTTFLAFDDAAPDRWGRTMLDAQARQDAKATGQRYKPLKEIDLLFAVPDETRQGAIRFKEGGTFLSTRSGAAPVRDLKALAQAAQQFVETGVPTDDMSELIGAGSSPGGAQPKAWVRDEAGNLLLAKFPKTSDLHDVSAWESALIEMQRNAGISVRKSWTLPLRAGESVFITERFDRDGERRIPYMSFKNFFGIADHEHPDYATLARRLASVSDDPAADANELFKRAAFSVLVNNIDDHMRNYGLLRKASGWRLSPSFDVNPFRRGHSDTPLTPEDDPADRDVRLLVETAESFRLTRQQAIHLLAEVEQATSSWRSVAVGHGVDPEALDSFGVAFETGNRDRIKRMAGQGSEPRIQVSAGEVWVKEHSRNGVKIEGHYRKRPSSR